MDLLVPIFAYLSTVTAIMVAVVMSYDVLVYAPLYSSGPPGTIAVAATPHDAKPAAKAAAKTVAAGSGTSRPLHAAARRRMVRRTGRMARKPYPGSALRETREWPRAYPPPLPRNIERDALGNARPPFGFGDDPFR